MNWPTFGDEPAAAQVARDDRDKAQAETERLRAENLRFRSALQLIADHAEDPYAKKLASACIRGDDAAYTDNSNWIRWQHEMGR